MEIVVTARHTEVPGRFRRHLDEKLAKVEQLAPRALRLEVAVSHEANKRQAEKCERIELTLRGAGPVVRAEACAADPYAALDMATTKLMERLRRASDRRKVHKVGHSGHHPRGAAVEVPLDGVVPEVVPAAAPAPAPLATTGGAPAANGAARRDRPAGAAAGDVDGADGDLDVDAHVHRGDADGEWVLGESPVVIRDKVHPATPMTLEVALEQMELVGHDFYLFVDAASGRPSVVYRRRGWSYGVLRLADDAAAPGAAGGTAAAAGAALGADAPSRGREPVTAG